MYNDIARNKRKTVLLVSFFSILILLLGWVFGAQNGDVVSGIVIAGIISLVMTLISYYQGDRVALKVSGARPIAKQDAPELYRLVENLSIAQGVPMPAVYLIQDSSPNAFATGRDPKHASVAVTTGLIQLLDKLELEGVLAHELSHIRNYDIRVMTIVVVLVGAILLLSDWLTRSFLYGRRRDDNGGQAGAILLVIGLALAILSPLLAELMKLAISRSREYLADASGALLTRHPEGLASALEKIAKMDQPMQRANHATAHLFLANPFDPHVTKKFESWFSTHPPIEERIARLRGMGL